MNSTNTTQAHFPKSTPSSSWLEKPLFWRITPAVILVLLIMSSSAGIFFSNLEVFGNANAYYTAAVEAMLDSWANFFFVAAEPGGSVTVDKPPLGLWVEAAFAYILGVNGFTVSLPNILASIFSIPLLYIMVKRYLGAGAGVLAAAVMAFTPVVFSTGRNNTMDSMLVFTLLLAAWAFIEAAERSSLGYLLLGGFVVGLGFNIKMMQAFLPLPAFVVLYFLVSREIWWRKALNLALTGVVIVVVSLSWAWTVDAVPADQRPYIGSSTNNTVMELIVGHNGLNRLFGGQQNRQAGGTDGAPSAGNLSPDNPGQTDGQLPPAPFQDGQGQPGDNPQGGGRSNDEIGSSGWLRFFQSELANESSWLLPFALVSVGLAIFSVRIQIPILAGTHKALILWGGWLLTCLVFFSVAAFYHAYYLVMLAPAIGGAVAMGWASLRQIATRFPWLAVGILTGTATLTFVVQVIFAETYDLRGAFLWVGGGILLIGMIMLLAVAKNRHLSIPATGMVFGGLLLIPLVWSVLTVQVESPNVNLPSAYAGSLDVRRNQPAGMPQDQPTQNLDRRSRLIDFLVENDSGGRYLVAVPSAMQGSEIVLETGRGVLYMGGFNGGDEVVGVEDLSELVSAGDLVYILSSDRTNRQVSQWMRNSCTPVDGFRASLQAVDRAQGPAQAASNRQPGDGPDWDGQPGAIPQNQQSTILYQCGG